METTQFKIVTSATKLFLLYGFKSVTMDDITDEAHMSKKTIYQHFQSKEQLISSVLQELEQKIKTQIDQVLCEAGNPVEAFFNLSNYIFLQQFCHSPTIFWTLKKYYPVQHSLFSYTVGELVYEKADEQLKKGIDEGIFIPALETGSFCSLLNHVSKSITNNSEISYKRNPDHEVMVKNFIYYSLRSVVTSSGLLLLEKLEKNKMVEYKAESLYF